MWVFAAEAATQEYNLTPHKSTNFQSPLSKLKPDAKNNLDTTRRFEWLSYVLIPNPERKFSDKSLKTFSVEYTKTGYTFWYPQHNRFIVQGTSALMRELFLKIFMKPKTTLLLKYWKKI